MTLNERLLPSKFLCSNVIWHLVANLYSSDFILACQNENTPLINIKLVRTFGCLILLEKNANRAKVYLLFIFLVVILLKNDTLGYFSSSRVQSNVLSRQILLPPYQLIFGRI